MTERPNSKRAFSAAERGFSVAELTVTVFVLLVVLVGALALFDFNNKLTRVQTQVAEMQQSLRIGQHDMVRLTRMTGRGGLPVVTPPAKLIPTGAAIEVRNNVAADENIGASNNAGPIILEGTDVLTIRGVFSNPIYQVNSADAATFGLGNPANGGFVVIRSVSPTGVPQDLTALIEAVNAGTPEALILVSPLDDSIYAVVELNPGPPTDVSDPDLITLAFSISGGTHTDAYQALSPGGVFPDTLTSVAFVGILEEYRYYVREEFAVDNDTSSDLMPKLARAQVFPNTDVPYNNNAQNWQLDIADNVFDLQMVLGFDSANAGGPGEPIVETDDGNDDDWLFNSSDDNPADPVWATATLFYVRLTTLARTDRRDPAFQAPRLVLIEDHSYQNPGTKKDFNSREERMYRRRLLQTVVDMRNLS